MVEGGPRGVGPAMIGVRGTERLPLWLVRRRAEGPQCGWHRKRRSWLGVGVWLMMKGSRCRGEGIWRRRPREEVLMGLEVEELGPMEGLSQVELASIQKRPEVVLVWMRKSGGRRKVHRWLWTETTKLQDA